MHDGHFKRNRDEVPKIFIFLSFVFVFVVLHINLELNEKYLKTKELSFCLVTVIVIDKTNYKTHISYNFPLKDRVW